MSDPYQIAVECDDDGGYSTIVYSTDEDEVIEWATQLAADDEDTTVTVTETDEE